MARPTKAPGYGPVRLRKDRRTGYWYARFTWRGKRETHKLLAPGGGPITNQRNAEREAREIAELLETGQWSKVKNRIEARKQTFANLVDEFLDKGCPQTRRRGGYWSESTLRQSRSTLDVVIRTFGERAIGDINAEEIEAYLARLRDNGRTKGTRNRHLAILKVLMAKAHEWGYVPADRVREIRTERVGRKKPRPYREEELGLLLAALQERHRSIATVYLETGLRRGELMKLLWTDVDWEERTVTVRDAKNADDRVVPLSKQAHAILVQRRQEWEHERRQTMSVDPRVYGSTADIRQVITRAMKALRFEPDRRAWLRPLNSLRDTFITRLARQGIPLDRRMKLSGHRDASMNLAYGEVEPEVLRDAITQTFDGNVGA